MPVDPNQGMKRHIYGCSDGGPFIILPDNARSRWSGILRADGSIPAPWDDALDPSTDYGRACKAIGELDFALLPVGDTHALLINNPPMAVWAMRDGESYAGRLVAWNTLDLDSLTDAAIAAAPLNLIDSQLVWTVPCDGLVMMAAAEDSEARAYGAKHLRIEPGAYRIMTSRFQSTDGEVRLAKLQRHV